MSNLDIHVSKVVLDFGKNKTATYLRLNVAFRIFLQIFNRPVGYIMRSIVRLDIGLSRFDIGMSNPCNQLGHMYIQPKARGQRHPYSYCYNYSAVVV